MSVQRDIDALFKELNALDKKLRNKTIRAAQRKAAKDIAAVVKANAPVDTGETKRSVKVRAGKRQKDVISTVVSVDGGPGEPFIGFVEFGTAQHPPNPFIRNAAESKHDEAIEIVIQAIEQAISEL